jgi:tetratricopeptide (TPR) repeat protein
MIGRGALVCFIVIATLPGLGGAQEREPDEFEQLQEIRRQFREGSYDAVERLATTILGSDPSILIRAETHQYLGASLELLGRSVEAEEQFEELLTLQPQFIMDQAEFPTEVITLFETVRLRVQDRISQIEERRRRAQEAERIERERRLRDEQERIQEISRPRYLVHEVRERHFVVTLMPFGAGQFQNGQRNKGYAFLGTELVLTAGSMIVWLLGSTLPDNADDPGRAGEIQDGYEIASACIYGTLGALVLAGIIDAIVNYFRAPRDRWQEMDEDDVPPDHRLGAERDREAEDVEPGETPAE